jgi:hypothetical protein
MARRAKAARSAPKPQRNDRFRFRIPRAMSH